MKQNNFSKLILGVSCLFLVFTAVANAGQKFATLPGGLLYPQFAVAAFSNAAALTSDWYSEVQALYSPENSDQSTPHSYLVGYATSNPKFGFNLGYLGSVQSGAAVHNVFSGLSARFNKHSFGLALRKNDLVYSTGLPIDVSWMWDISKRLTVGAVGYDVLENKTLALGIGYEDFGYYSLELDTQFPLPGYPTASTQEYSVNLASVLYLKNTVGISLGTRYQKWVDPAGDSSEWRHTFGTVVKLKRKLSLVGLYTSSPDTLTVGLCWGNPATAQQWTDHWLARDRQGLNQ